jgi:serine/threonine-protein kinase
MEIVAPEEGGLAAKTQVLRSRLLAAAILVTTGLAGLFLRAVLLESDINPWLRGAVFIATIGALIVLAGPRVLTFTQLRAVELLLFVPVGVQLLTTQTGGMLAAAEAGNAAQLASHCLLGATGFVLLLMTYAIFMPNSWQRTAVMLLPPAIAPVGSLICVRQASPFAAEAFSLFSVVELGLIMGIAYGAATFGTATIASLRQQARRAEQLGQYRLKRRIGSGGMGEVFLAEHQLLKRPCAIKLVKPGQGADPVALARFEHEVRSTAKLSHWNTVEIYDYGHTDDGTFYYVMEFLPGMNLWELVKRFGPLPPERVIHFLRQVCGALQEAHSVGMVHRDLKPANVHASRRGGMYDVAKLLDFGLAVEHSGGADPRYSSPSHCGPFSGSPLFMSPEQASGESRLDPRSDLYSLGALGYYLLVGKPPFEGESAWRVMIAHARDPVIPPSFWMSHVPDDLEAILLKCLSKNPSERYASAAMVAEELAACQHANGWSEDQARNWWAENAPEIDLPTRALMSQPVEFQEDDLTPLALPGKMKV